MNRFVYLLLPVSVMLLASSVSDVSGGSIVCWGYNGYGQCDVPDPNQDFVALVRQAKLGASFRVSYSLGVASPCRAKLNQQPVPSVVPVAEPKYVSVNKTGKAYTGNTVGRRGSVLPSSDSAPLTKAKQLATTLTHRKPVHMNRYGEILRDCRGHRAWHAVREASGTWETLPPPAYRVRHFNQKKDA